MNEIYVRRVKLKGKVTELVALDANGDYNIYISEAVDDVRAMKAYQHACKHIQHGDFEKLDVQAIEKDAHKEGII
ncbi:MAG: hypothetical protein Q4B15_07870 [Lachnospiraceae bacterium]|nr:hypothetical protein [Lachnospiraceae bacterium]